MQYYKNALYFIKGSAFIDLTYMYGHEHLNKNYILGNVLFYVQKKEKN